MEDKLSVHDNFLLSYTVNCRENMITMHTEYTDREPYELTDVVFTGVIAYHLECDDLNTIILQIEETALHYIYTEYTDLFARLKYYSWPLFCLGGYTIPLDYKTPDELIDMLQARNIKGFRFRSTLGMEGFVLAQEMRLIAVSV